MPLSFEFVFFRLPEVPAVGNLRLLPSLLCCEATTVEPGSWFCFWFSPFSLKDDVNDATLQSLLKPRTGGGNGNPLQSSCLENPVDRGAWRTTVPGVTKSQTRLGD